MKQGITDETVKLDKKFVEEFVVENEDGKMKTKSKDEWRILIQKIKKEKTKK